MKKPPSKPPAKKPPEAPALDTPYRPALPKAQECYDASLAALANVDTSAARELLVAKIAEGVAAGQFMTYLQPLDPLVAEKFSIELDALGYRTGVYNSSVPLDAGGGSYKPGAMLNVNWKNMPHNTRDKHTL